MATLWTDRKPCKIIQTSKGRRKLVGYFENWETTLRALDTPQVFVAMTKNTPDKKKSASNQSKKKDNSKSSKKVSENNNQVKKNPNTKKKAKNSSKKKGRNKDNKEVLAEILTLLQKLV
ncbi:unnamed protein product [Rhizophagus irregularis]|nr:unnamed protein product [Rhizophagus irregularis]